MKKIAAFVWCVALAMGGGSRAVAQDRDQLMQVSVIDALLAGEYDGLMTCGELKQYGDFGIGTFDQLNGEMTVLDGEVYAVRPDGEVQRVAAEETTPFAVVTPFDADQVIRWARGPISYADFQKQLQPHLPTLNHFYAVRVDGHFNRMKTRSVPRQEPPYPPLLEVVARQSEFNFEQVEGTLVGFWSPPFVKGVNVPGWHFHFLNTERTAGGHVLDFEFQAGQVTLDATPRIYIWLPETGSFLRTNLEPDREGDLHTVEKDRSGR